VGSVRTPVDDADRPRLGLHVRLTYDEARGRHVLLTPEAVTLLNATGATILELCDGERTLADIIAELRERYEVVLDAEVRDFLARLVEKRCVEITHGDRP
jgi:pyrroloquinoline quinone biosynthesis protein D